LTNPKLAVEPGMQETILARQWGHRRAANPLWNSSKNRPAGKMKKVLESPALKPPEYFQFILSTV